MTERPRGHIYLRGLAAYLPPRLVGEAALPSVHCKTALFALAQLTLISWPARAQTTTTNDSDAEKPAARRESVERVEPDILYIRENGELVPLINLKLDDIRAFMEARSGTATGPRAASRLERLELRGEVVGGYATLAIELTVAASDASWMRVPLRLGNFVLTDPAAFADDGEHLIEFDPASREFVAWFRGKTEKPHRLTLRGMVAVDRDGAHERLKINAPRAVFSELELKVPLAGAVGQVVTGGVLTDTKPAQGATQFRATGLANDFLLTWQAAAPRRAESPTALSVDGQIVAKIDGRGVDSEATLRVSSFGREFNSFQISLPRGATLLPAQDSDYSIVDLPPQGDTDKDGPQRKRVELRLKTKTSQPVTVKLVAKQGHDVGRDGVFDLSGFEVAGAVRQSGILAVQVRDDWQVAFVNRQGVVQTDELPPEMRPEGVVAGFLYFGQPYSLSARVSPRQTRTSVEPRYIVEVGPHHMQLEASLKYHVAGAKVFSFSIELGDWQLDPAGLEPAAVVNAPALVFGAGNSVLVPLKQATTGDVELRIRARRPIPAGADSIEFGLLRPTADTVASTELVVVPEDNVILEPQSDDKSGLIGTLPNAEPKLPAHRQPAWFYRSDVAEPRFRANFHIAARRITSRIESQVSLREGGIEVRQKLRSTVFHEAASSFLLAVPQSLASAAIEAELDGKSLPLEPAAVDDSSEGPAAMRLLLPDQRLGDLEFTLSYTWQDDALDELVGQQATVMAEIPLVMPAEGELIENVLSLSVDPGLHAESVDKHWTVDTTAIESGRQSLSFSASRPQPSLLVGIRAADGEASGALVVERAWLQTLLSGNQRFDRAVFRFRTRDRRLTLTLPAGALGESFRLNGQPITALPGANAQDRLFALNDTDLVDEPRVLEAMYETTGRSAGSERLSLDLPSLGAQGRARLFYWQLVLPSDEYLLAGPPGLEGEFVWQWRGLGWSRQPLRDTTELEIWSGATEHEIDIAPSANVYLFSGPAAGNRVEVATVSRPLLVLVSSGLLLVLGLVWLYAPVLRRPALLLAAGIAVVAVAAIWPDLALLAVQSAAVGLVLIVVGHVLERSLGRRPVRPGYRSAPSSIVGRSSTHTHPRALPPVASTQTAALVGELPQP